MAAAPAGMGTSDGPRSPADKTRAPASFEFLRAGSAPSTSSTPRSSAPLVFTNHTIGPAIGQPGLHRPGDASRRVFCRPREPPASGRPSPAVKNGINESRRRSPGSARPPPPRPATGVALHLVVDLVEIHDLVDPDRDDREQDAHTAAFRRTLPDQGRGPHRDPGAAYAGGGPGGRGARYPEGQPRRGAGSGARRGPGAAGRGRRRRRCPDHSSANTP